MTDDDLPLPFAIQAALHDLGVAYRGQMRAALQLLQLPLTPNELKVLLHVAHHPLCTHKDVMRHTGADKAQVARLLQQMEAAQWLERVPHPEDGRSRCLRLLPRGQQAYAGLRAHRQTLAQHMLEGSSEAAQRQLLEQLRQLHRQLSTLPMPTDAQGHSVQKPAEGAAHIHD